MKFASSLALIAATLMASTLNAAVQASGLADTRGTAPGVTVLTP